jgi:hypothetical protein
MPDYLLRKPSSATWSGYNVFGDLFKKRGSRSTFQGVVGASETDEIMGDEFNRPCMLFGLIIRRAGCVSIIRPKSVGS